MNEWLTVITSSPGPTPTPCSARCRAVVQFDTAQACAGARRRRRTLARRPATSGPASPSPTGSPRRRGVRLLLAQHRAWRSGSRMRRRSRSTSPPAPVPPPLDQAAQPLLQGDLGHEAELALRPRVVSASRRGTGLTFRSGWNSGSRSAPVTSLQRCRQLVEAVSVPLATLYTSSVDVRLHRQDVGPGDVLDVDEVHRLRCRRRGSAGGLPASMQSSQRIKTSVYAPFTSIRGP